jgi:putative addiction module component (TIGR02574 family)
MPSLMESLGVDRLSDPERLQLVEEILDSLDDSREPPPLSEELRLELERRIAYLDANPGAVTPWEEVKARILAKLRS